MLSEDVKKIAGDPDEIAEVYGGVALKEKKSVKKIDL